jgi:hypothetical protein
MSTSASPPRSPITICTLWQIDYHKGLAALANSLVIAGYRGTVWAGYRGPLPAWASNGVTDGAMHIYSLTEAVSITFVPIDTPQHFSHYKPIWIADVLNTHAPEAEGIFYFDPDIFLEAPWPFFEDWLNAGIAVCQDATNPVNPTHPRAHNWKAFAEATGIAVHRMPQCYINGGIVGLKRDSLVFLDNWRRILDRAHQIYNFGPNLMHESRSHIFHSTDQDALNVALMTAPGPISWLGPDGMNFRHGQWCTVHAIAFKKPWNRRVFFDWLTRGHGVERCLRVYWRFAEGPARAESRLRIQLHKFLLPFVALLSRFYCRR